MRHYTRGRTFLSAAEEVQRGCSAAICRRLPREESDAALSGGASMSQGPKKDLAHSIRQRLQQIATASGRRSLGRRGSRKPRPILPMSFRRSRVVFRPWRMRSRVERISRAAGLPPGRGSSPEGSCRNLQSESLPPNSSVRGVPRGRQGRERGRRLACCGEGLRGQ